MIRFVPMRSKRRKRLIDRSRSSRLLALLLLGFWVLSPSSFGQTPQKRPADKGQVAKGQAAKGQAAKAKKPVEIAYQRLDINPCVRQGRFVIDDKSTLQSLVEQDRANPGGYCKHFANHPPQIDFTKHVLLGVRTTTDLCQKFELKILRDDAGKRYRHILIAKQLPRCEGIGYVSFWVLIPKLLPDYTVAFENQVGPEKNSKQ